MVGLGEYLDFLPLNIRSIFHDLPFASYIVLGAAGVRGAHVQWVLQRTREDVPEVKFHTPPSPLCPPDHAFRTPNFGPSLRPCEDALIAYPL